MPLTFARTGEKRRIRKISGKEDAKRFLGSLGFVEGAEVTVLSDISGDLIVHVKESRVAISKEMACKIFV